MNVVIHTFKFLIVFVVVILPSPPDYYFLWPDQCCAAMRQVG